MTKGFIPGVLISRDLSRVEDSAFSDSTVETLAGLGFYVEGGKGSGFFGHLGRKKKRGGSVKRKLKPPEPGSMTRDEMVRREKQSAQKSAGKENPTVESFILEDAKALAKLPVETSLVYYEDGSIADVVRGSEDRVSLPVATMYARKNRASIHNHPGEVVNIMTRSDLAVAFGCDNSSTHAVFKDTDGKIKVFSVYRREKGWPDFTRFMNSYEETGDKILDEWKLESLPADRVQQWHDETLRRTLKAYKIRYTLRDVE